MKFINKINFERLIRFDSIRVLKLLEISQFSIIGFLLGLYLGAFIDKLVPEPNVVSKDKNKFLILIETIIHMIGLIIIGYYIQKLAHIFNFCCGFLNKKYVSSLHEESTIGITIGLAFIFSATQKKLKTKISYLTKRFI